MNIDDYFIIMCGRIEEYFPVTQTSTVIISHDTTYSDSSNDDEIKPHVVLRDVPTYTTGGGGWHMTFPIKKGNPCMLKFSQFGYDHWFVDNKDSAGVRSDGNPHQWTYRRFDMSDGFAQVGFNTLPDAVQNYHSTASQWRNSDASQVISLNDDLSIVITSPTSITVNSPEVVANCENARINATTKTTITSPETEVTGNLLVAGGLSVTGSSGASITGEIDAASMLLDGIQVLGHVHKKGGGQDTEEMK